ncbi:MotA/TolQ/ExbB proton channel family protein [Xylella fastidiosa subsp. multiplex]|uniref:Biopolymer transport protein ExbB n=1 Tax=Xylella fastidiosa subsp. multiplex TaxID=644357 RepID=A0AAW6HUA0_XYLFS|nr:MotA/TolQ/ExbB proton channel family protein [Xylella fastidiosa]MDC6407797.1 MotA/TolQ/ExbB proton channel family protein [Xylella fastidiosa subsp. multiplex]MDD0936497.1 MotA/TolQ/ExbB proton channel family protein [Xylella fastidiosa subsp. multiplex]
MLQDLFIVATAGGSNPSNALSKMGVWHLIGEMTASPAEFAVSWAVLIILVTMSSLSWYWTVINILRALRLKGTGYLVINAFWKAKTPQEAISAMEKQSASEPFSKIALDASQAAAHHQRTEGGNAMGLGERLSLSEFVDRALRQAVTRESSKLQSGMTLLATVGATAPFVGLLGTVWGIYNALITIGATGSASIDAVAGPVGEALIMTAIGLFVAIPAVFAFNFFSKINSSIIAKFDTFTHDLHDFFATGSRVR